MCVEGGRGIEGKRERDRENPSWDKPCEYVAQELQGGMETWRLGEGR